MFEILVLIEYGALKKTYSYVSDFYIEPYKRVKIVFNGKLLVGLSFKCQEYIKASLNLNPIVEVLDDKPIISGELLELAEWMEKYYLSSKIKVIQTILPISLRPNTNDFKPVNLTYFRFVNDHQSKYLKQAEAISFMKEKQEVLTSEFNKLFPGQSKRLLELNVIEKNEREKRYQAVNNSLKDDLILSSDQEKIYQELIKQEHHVVNLLHGITGSGKSEVFLRVTKKWVERDKQVLILVPEIGLTPQMINLFIERLGDSVAIYHSKLNQQERYQQYQRIIDGEVKVVVGTRSAVFLPFENLGCVIIDEEHDDSYKQDKDPRYHTRDIAIFRGKHHDCSVVLASATPSLDSYARALKKVYNLLVLDKRVNGSLPNIELVDMSVDIRENGNQMISGKLRDEISKTLNSNQQAIILLNRRGYTPVVKCQSCQEVIQCDNCDISMVYHKDNRSLQCHTCGSKKPYPKVCPSCGSSDFFGMGYGTERLQEELQHLFPQAVVVRMDRDTTGKKEGSSLMIQDFKDGLANILVGTQMLAKGLDFPNVSLVGILNSDALLNRLDYRAQETTFSLLTQASGRAGRVIKDSKVIIQAYQVDHYALKYVVNHDYYGFFVKEMKYRKMADYPPYQYLALLTINGTDSEKLKSIMESVKNDLECYDIRVLGPSELPKRFNLLAARLTLKGKDLSYLQDKINVVLKKYDKHQIYVDVNPQHTQG